MGLENRLLMLAVGVLGAGGGCAPRVQTAEAEANAVVVRVLKEAGVRAKQVTFNKGRTMACGTGFHSNGSIALFSVALPGSGPVDRPVMISPAMTFEGGGGREYLRATLEIERRCNAADATIGR